MADISRRQLFAGAAGLAVVGGLAACGNSGSSSPSTSPTQAAGQPKRGGNFRLGVTGGGSKDIMDGQNIITKPDQARLMTAFETLLLFDDNYQLTTNGLAESVTQDNSKQYTIKLRQGIEFQNGKTLTADDVIYSFQHIGTKGNGLTGYAATATMNIAGMKKLDKYTVRLPLKTPDSTVPQTLASYTFGIVPTGYQAYPHAQVGTGAYKLKSFTPGTQSVHERNPNYWRSGQPYFDTVTIIDFSDSTAQVNGLLGGQIDAMTDLPPSQVKVVQARGLAALVSKTGGWLPICMAIDMPPFDDARVRQAMRLIVDRPGMLEQVASGYGFIGNDLYAPFDPSYNHSLPQRHQDITQGQVAAQGGRYANLSVDLHTTNGAAGMVETATVFANQAQTVGRQDQRDQRPELLREPVPQAGLLDRLLGHPLVSQPGAAGLAAERPVQRDALAAEVGHRVQLRGAVQPGPGHHGRGHARPDRARDAADRVRHRRLHHPLLRRPHRRLLGQGEGAQAEQGHAQPG